MVKTTGTAKVFEKEYLRKDGSRVPILLGGATFGEGQDQGVAFVLDLTERKRAEAAARGMQLELAHANRVATMGQLTASIAHEVKQPIAATATNAAAALRWLGAQPPNLEEAREALGRSVNEAMRAGDIVGRIRELIKKAPSRKDSLDINEAIREVIELTRGEAVRTGVSVQTRLADGLPLIHGDRVQLQQVILNLTMNAVEAMSGIAEAPRELLITTGLAKSSSVLVAVRDSRAGIGAGDCRAPVRGVLHHQAQRPGDGPVDLPVDRRRAWGTIVGGGERTAGRRLPVPDAGVGVAGTRPVLPGADFRLPLRGRDPRWSATPPIPYLSRNGAARTTAMGTNSPSVPYLDRWLLSGVPIWPGNGKNGEGFRMPSGVRKPSSRRSLGRSPRLIQSGLSVRTVLSRDGSDAAIDTRRRTYRQDLVVGGHSHRIYAHSEG